MVQKSGKLTSWGEGSLSHYFTTGFSTIWCGWLFGISEPSTVVPVFTKHTHTPGMKQPFPISKGCNRCNPIIRKLTWTPPNMKPPSSGFYEKKHAPRNVKKNNTEEQIPMITLYHDHQQGHIQLTGCCQLSDTSANGFFLSKWAAARGWTREWHEPWNTRWLMGILILVYDIIPI